MQSGRSATVWAVLGIATGFAGRDALLCRVDVDSFFEAEGMWQRLA